MGRKHVLVAGWLVAVPVPFLLMWAPTWNWVLVANLLLGISQGLTWSTTVIMKIDLVGREQRGLAMGLNEFAGLRGGGRERARHRLDGRAVRPSAAAVLPRRRIRDHRTRAVGPPRPGNPSSRLARIGARRHAPSRACAHAPREVFWRTTLVDANLSSVSQAGLVNNLNDGMAWGLFPLVFAAAGMDLAQVGLLAAIYPATWGFAQLVTGALSDRTGRKPLIVWGMWIQAAGIGVTTLAQAFAGFVVGAVLLGIGTAMVYPTLLAAIGDVAHPSWRASAVGVYRLWRDLGYAIGAVLAGVTADAFGSGRRPVGHRRTDLRVRGRIGHPNGRNAAANCCARLRAPTGSPGRRSLARNHTRRRRTGRSSEFAHNARRRE